MTVAHESPSRSRTVSWVLMHRGLVEFALVGGCLLVYFLVRGNVVDRPAGAFEHAAGVIDLEERWGIFWEPSWQSAIRSDLAQVRFWNDVYFWAHAPVIAVIAFWLYFRHQRHYRLIRNAFLISALLGLLVYALYPVAPPRLMTESGYREYGLAASAYRSYGFADTMREYSNVSYQAESLKPFVNPFAAMPSLHFGWAFLIGLAVFLARRNPLTFLFAFALPVMMLLAIVLTANHFILDAAAGWVICLFGLAAALALRRVPLPMRERLTPAFLRSSPADLQESD